MRLIAIYLLVIPLFCIAQQTDNEVLDSIIIHSNSSTYSKLNFIQISENARIIAKEDISKSSIYIFLKGGICPLVYTTDSAFMAKHNVMYYDFGCLPPPIDNIENYNFEIFIFLRASFGKKWIKEIRKDAVGLKKWRKSHRKRH
jgi:hypothetical protein